MPRGGFRPGSGRPKGAKNRKSDSGKVASKAAGKVKKPSEQAKLYDDPKDYLMDQMNDPGLDERMRADAAKALLPYVHKKLGEGGKKEERNEAARKVASRFSPAAPPKLVAAGGKKVQ